MTAEAATDPTLDFVDIDTSVPGRDGGTRCRLRTATWGTGTPSIVLLHEGLGSIGQWRTFPAELHEQTGATVMAYERAGHGKSTPVPNDAWPADWLHHEAVVFDALLDRLGIVAPLVVGHSDGGSIALIHAAEGGGPTALVAMAAHSWVESICTEAISAVSSQPGAIVSGLARHHDAPAEMFAAWSGVWLSGEFSSWDIRPMIAAVECPTLVMQGDVDEYATEAQLVETAAAIGNNATARLLAGVGHAMHRAAPAATVDLIAAFYDQHLSAPGVAEGD